MNGSIVEMFNKIMDSRFYQTLISIFLTFVSYLFLNDNMVIIKEFGKSLSFIFFFILWLLVIELILFVYRVVKNIYIRKQDINFLKRQREIENKEKLEQLWTIIDGMKKTEKDNLMYFLDNDNKPLLDNKEYPYSHLLGTEWVYKAEYNGTEKITEQVKVIKKPSSDLEGKAFGNMLKSREVTPRYQYILREDIYVNLKHSLSEYGKISHFD